MLDKRKILKSERQDQLMWGYNNEGAFNLKKEKIILLDVNTQALDKIWLELWRQQGWMKIKLFIWLVQHRKILTWDKIRKRGVLGTSICQLCEAQEETMENLLNNCIFTSSLWILLPPFSTKMKNKKGISSTPSTIREETFQRMKFVAQHGP